MKVLVIGSGGREHALVWQIAKDPRVKKIYAAPGNGGMAEQAELVDIGAEDIETLAEFAATRKIDLAIVGPEGPLARGIVDLFTRKALRIFGPTKAAARLESSKSFAKNLLKKLHVPTPHFAVFDDSQAAKAYVKQAGVPIVVKADGLCGGKGAIVATTMSEALGAIDLMMEDKIFKQAGERVVIEEWVAGEEVSVLGITDGKHVVILPAAQDHKRVFDGDKGPNTGGMGAYAPAPIMTPELQARITREIIEPVLHGLAKDDILFRGVLYCGLMLTADGPTVLEFNVRFGDPELQAVLPLVRGNFVELIDAVVDGTLTAITPQWAHQSCACVAVASGGYPGEYAIGKEITGLAEAGAVEGAVIFHAGTKREGERLLTWGGRVLNVVGVDDDLEGALKRAYAAIERIHFDGMHYRKDIGWRAVKKSVGTQP